MKVTVCSWRGPQLLEGSGLVNKETVDVTLEQIAHLSESYEVWLHEKEEKFYLYLDRKGFSWGQR
jgi:hypothetical protein